MADKTNKRELFGELVRLHHRRILAFALALVPDSSHAEDLVQDALVTAFQKLHTFDAGRDFGAWVRGIVRNKHREHCRRDRGLVFDADRVDQLEATHSQWDRQEKHPGDALRALRTCIGKLPEALRGAVELFYLKQLPGALVAEKLSANAATVRKRLERARSQLARCVEKTLTEEDVHDV